MGLATGQSVGPQLIEALGLPKHTKSFELRAAVDEVVSITCTYYAEKDGVIAGIDILSKNYCLIPFDKPPTTFGRALESQSNPDGTRRWPGPLYVDVSTLLSKTKQFFRRRSFA